MLGTCTRRQPRLCRGLLSINRWLITTYMYVQYLTFWYCTVRNALHVIVHDGVKSVCNGDYGRVSKLCSYGFLDEVISLQVHGSCGLVQHQDLGLTEESSSQTHQLTLTNTVRKTTK